MYHALVVSYWLMLPIAILAAGFLARIFIIFHDCGHSSFFKSRAANNVMGAIAGLLNLTPYRHWRWQHALHHGTAGNLDKRGAGDIWTLTVQEFRDASRWTRRFIYLSFINASRHPRRPHASAARYAERTGYFFW
jgi:omega-6 fatty acid desaturase (delta-12 desaturase)